MMNTDTAMLEVRSADDSDAANLQTFVRQVEDQSLPAPEVLRLQREDRASDRPTQVFIP